MTHFLAPLLAGAGAPGVVWIERTGLPLASYLEAAFDARRRRRGLLGRDRLEPDAAIVLAPCWAVHTCAMRFPIDVVFARRDGVVTRLCPHVKPWWIAVAPGAFAALEIAAGAIVRSGLRTGDRLEVTVAQDRRVS